MAIPYETLLPEIIPMVPGCPDTLIENSIRAAITELCEKAGVWQEEIQFSTAAGQYDYTLTTPTDSVVHKVMTVIHKGVELEPISSILLEQRKPKWRETDYYGTPEYWLYESSALRLVPVPSDGGDGSTIARVQLKPTIGSTETTDRLIVDYRDIIVNGAIYRLLRMPLREWTDYAGAQVYGTLFNQDVIAAERRARQANTGIARKVKYGGLHAPLSKKRNRYGRETR